MRPMEHLRAVLFDFGGVFTATPLAAFRECAPEYGVTADELTDMVLGPRNVDTDHPWHRLERGEMTSVDAVAEIRNTVLQSHGFDLDPWKVLTRTKRSAETRQQMLDRVRAIRKVGLQTAIVTNNLKEISSLWRASLPIDGLFDTVVDSCEVGVRKPNPRIYQLAAERLANVGPEHCAFLDDLVGNVAGAEAVGMTGVLVEEDKISAFAWLDALVASRTG